MNAITTEPRLSASKNPVQTKFAPGLDVLRPFLAMKLNLTVAQLPPLVITGIQDIREGCPLPSVVYCDVAPVFLLFRVVDLLLREAVAAGEDTDCGSIPSLAESRDGLDFFGCSTSGVSYSAIPIATNSSAMFSGTRNRCFLLTEPTQRFTKLVLAFIHTCSMLFSPRSKHKPPLARGL
jgi:hypothetical protein